MSPASEPAARAAEFVPTVVVPVNAQSDLATVEALLDDLAAWTSADSRHAVVLVVNNYDAERPPAFDGLQRRGIQIIAEPKLPLRHGEVPPIAARVLGARRARPGLLVHFDADVRIPNVEAVLGWYQRQFVAGARVAATGIGFHDVPASRSVRARIAAHHAARWAKRVVLRAAVTRGSNYATDRDLFLEAYDNGTIADELNVGPAITALGGRYAYGHGRDLRVFTSARRLRPGWLRLARYLRYRLLYNLRTLPVRGRAGERTRRWQDPADRWEPPS